MRILLANAAVTALAALLLASRVLAASTPARPTVAQGLMVNISADAMFGCVPFPAPLEKATAEQMVRGYRGLVERYVGTQVSHLFFNVNFQRAAFDSEAWATYWDVPDPTKQTSGWPRMSWLVHRAGVDPFAICIAECRKRGLSPWLSMRMNDTHYIGDPTKANPFWKDHPELRRAPNSGFDFAHAEVREHHLALLRELLERYDPDGIELDWMRFAWHFTPGQAEKGRPRLTEFVRQVRELADQAAKRRGHPVGIAARVPGRPDFAHGLEMDGVTWVREGLVDLLIPCSTWRPTDTDMPIEPWRRLIGEADRHFTIAAGADLWIQCRPGGTLMRDNLASARGFTAAMMHRGADAIYLFNHFNTGDFRHEFPRPDGTSTVRDEYHTLMSEVGKLETVLGKPRRHVLTFSDTAPPGVPNPRPLPAELKKGRPFTVRLYTGPRPKSGNVILRLGLDERPGLWAARLAATVNGTACRPIADLNKPGDFKRPPGRGSHVVWRVAEVAPRVARLTCPNTAVQEGYQGIAIALAEGEPQRIVWLEAAFAP